MKTASSKRTGKEKTYRITILGLLSALLVIMVFTPLGMIPLGPISITLVHIPVLLGLFIEGPAVGVLLGLFFGLLSCFRAFVAPATLLSPFFQNPLVSVLPRVLFPLFGWLVLTLLKKKVKNPKVLYALSGLGASVFHTVCVLGMLMLLHGQQILAAVHQSIHQFANSGLLPFILAAIALPNGVPEAVITALVMPPLVLSIQKFKRK